MRIAIVDTLTGRAEALAGALLDAGYEAKRFPCADEHLRDRDWANAEVVFLHFSERQQADWRQLAEGGHYRGRRVVLYAGGVTVWRHYVEAYQDALFCKYDRVVGDPPEPVVIEDFLRYLRAVSEGQQGALCDILNGIDWVLEAKLECLSRVLGQGSGGINVQVALEALDENLRSVLVGDPDAGSILRNAPESLIELRNKLLPDEPEWARR